MYGMKILEKVNKMLLFAALAGVLLVSGCALNRQSASDVDVASGKVQLSGLQFREQDIVSKINELSGGAAVAGERAVQAPAAQKQVQLKNLADKYDQALIRTNVGDIKVQFYTMDAPLSVNNFLNLAEEGFYNSTMFHRVIKDFMIQGGDPTGTGMGGPGYNIKDEFTHSGGNKNKRGTISMANAGPNTGGSQFFINLVDNNFLDGKHPAFGEVVEGMDVVDAIAKMPTDSNDRPVKEVAITKVRIE